MDKLLLVIAVAAAIAIASFNLILVEWLFELLAR